LIKWDKEGHYILIKGEIHQKEITIIKLYAPNINTPNLLVCSVLLYLIWSI
jgi:hypothetical protein